MVDELREVHVEQVEALEAGWAFWAVEGGVAFWPVVGGAVTFSKEVVEVVFRYPQKEEGVEVEEAAPHLP